MAAEWYYTTNKQQMGPVSWPELRELASGGLLKPQDLVWTDGMEGWAKASNQNGLFAKSAAGGRSSKKDSKAAYVESKPPPGRRTRRREEEPDEDAAEEERDEKRRRRRSEQERAKMGVGIKVGLIMGGVLVLLFLGVSCVGGIVWISWPKANVPVPAAGVHESYTIRNLAVTPNGADPNAGDIRRFTFQQGKRVVITVSNTTQFNNTDVDLYVYEGNNLQPLAIDILEPPITRDCRVEFIVPRTSQYKIRVVNLGPGRATSSVVRIDEN